MKTPICPTCGCSLVRLGISNAQASVYYHNDEKYLFCCKGCVDLFVTDPEKFLEESRELIVCPSCLAEKPPDQAVTIKIEGQAAIHNYICNINPFEKWATQLNSKISRQIVLEKSNRIVLPSPWAFVDIARDDQEKEKHILENCCKSEIRDLTSMESMSTLFDDIQVLMQRSG